MQLERARETVKDTHVEMQRNTDRHKETDRMGQTERVSETERQRYRDIPICR